MFEIKLFVLFLYLQMLLHPGSHNHPLTAPTVSPEMKYLWKNGYTQAIGITTSTAIAMRIDSVGIEFLYCCSESPAVGLLDILDHIIQ